MQCIILREVARERERKREREKEKETQREIFFKQFEFLAFTVDRLHIHIYCDEHRKGQ